MPFRVAKVKSFWACLVKKFFFWNRYLPIFLVQKVENMFVIFLICDLDLVVFHFFVVYLGPVISYI